MIAAHGAPGVSSATRQRPAQRRVDAEDAKVSAGHKAALNVDGRVRAAKTDWQERGIRHGGHACQRPLPVAERLVDRIEQHEPFVSIERTDHDELVRPRHRKRTQHHGIENREDRRRRPDTECEGEECDAGEAWTRAEDASGVAEILKRVIEERHATSITARVLDAVSAAEHQPRLTFRLVLAHSACRQLLDVVLDVKSEFIVELTFDGIAPGAARARIRMS